MKIAMLPVVSTQVAFGDPKAGAIYPRSCKLLLEPGQETNAHKTQLNHLPKTVAHVHLADKTWQSVATKQLYEQAQYSQTAFMSTPLTSFS